MVIQMSNKQVKTFSELGIIDVLETYGVPFIREQHRS